MGFRFFEETRFKETEIGLIPEDWQVVRLGEVAEERVRKLKDIYKDNTSNIEIYSLDRYKGLIPQKIKFKKRVASNNLSNYKVIMFGDIVYGFPIDEGVISVHLDDVIACVSPAYYVLKLKNLLYEVNFLNHLLKQSFMIEQYIKYSTNTVERRRIIKIENFKNVFAPLPPLPEQKAIAEVLRTIQEAKEKTEAVIKATKELKKSMMKHLFSYGVNGVYRVDGVGELKETEIGLIPKHWQVVRLGEVLTKTQYGLSKRGMANAKYPILRMNNLADGKVNFTDLQFVNLTEEEVEKFTLNQGDILFNRTNSFELVGKVGLFDLEGKYVFASYLIRLKCDTNKLLPTYFVYYLSWELTQLRLKKLASRGVSQSNISASKLREFKIPLPPLSEQKAIAEILQAIDEKIQKEEAKKQAIENLFKTMLSNLMSGKIRVRRVESL